MPRRNPGPRLKWLNKRKCWFVQWFEHGRERLRSTGTADSEEAQVALAEFIRKRTTGHGPRDPNDVLVTDLLVEYADQRAPHLQAPERIGYALEPLATFFEGKVVGAVNEDTCEAYRRWRQRSNSTVRRELVVLRSAINRATLTRPVKVYLPAESAPATVG
jgi:hypothetical protein